LCPSEWRINGNTASDGNLRVKIKAEGADVALELCEGWESRFYLRKAPLPVLEAKFRVPAIVTTFVEFA
ncbi:MAG: hypothetical protein M3R07_09600, partial [Gemmatimonadota bacterium]|nr:hypothetical protein [Gemmatimonadota bacterium]